MMSSTANEILESTRNDRRPITLVSSLGGFSESVYKSIRSLHDLLTAIQPLGLDLFDGSKFQKLTELGEGASYRVRKCVYQPSNQVIAMKRVKMPAKSAGLDAFHGRVACVLRDIEVMSHQPLAACNNIIGLRGYGWRLGLESIPFLITEYAQHGTLRQFLRDHESCLFGSERIKLCRDIGNGLEELHLAGVAHGDLKLDNILVCSHSSSPEDSLVQGDLPITIKLADFGYSLLIHHEDQNGDEQKYNGTELYNAPELSHRSQIVWTNVDFRKCDIWALGLTCWEVMLDGRPYYEDLTIRNFLSQISRQVSHASGSRTPNTDRNSSSRSDDITHNLIAVKRSLASLVDDFAATRLRRIVPGILPRKLLRALFAGALKADPVERVGEVWQMPLHFGTCTDLLVPRRQLAETAAKLSEWTFENFRPSQLMSIPHAAKEQMFHDFRHVARSRRNGADACKASFQVALALCVGFGVDRNLEQFGIWMQQSADQGLEIASIVHSWFKRQSEEQQTESEAIMSYQRLFTEGLLVATKRSHVKDANDSDPDESEHDGSDLDEPRLKYHFARDIKDVSEMVIKQHSMGKEMSEEDISQCLHWLFILDAKDVEAIVPILRTRYRRHTSSQCEQGSSTKREDGLLDPQLPLCLFGYPLLDAVAAASLPAVEGLLSLGASPFKNYSINETDTLTALELATSLHLYPLVKVFARRYTEIVSTNLASRNINLRERYKLPDKDDMRSGLIKALSISSFSHRYLVHGPHVATAQRKMVNYFLFEPGPFQLKNPIAGTVSSKILESAVINGDFDLVQAWLELENSCKTTHSAILNTEGKAALVLATVEILCREVVSWSTGIKFLEDLLKRGCTLDAEIAGLLLPQPIHLIIDKHHKSLYEWVVERSFNPNGKDLEGRTCLHHMLSSRFSNMDRLKTLLDLGALPQAPDDLGVTPMHVAVECNLGDELVEMLHRHPVIERDAAGDTVFHYVAKTGNVDLLGRLSPFLASNVNSPNQSGRTPLLVAAALGTERSIEAFLKVGADSKLHDDSGMSWLHIAGSEGNVETVTAILKLLDAQESASLALFDLQGDTALVSTCRHIDEGRERERLICCELLLAAGSKPEIPLHISVEKGHAKLVSMILEYNPQLQHECASQNPLWLNTNCLCKAAFYQDQSIVDLLLKATDNPQIDSKRKTCLEYVFLGHSRLVKHTRSVEPTTVFWQLVNVIESAFSTSSTIKDKSDNALSALRNAAFHVAILTNQSWVPFQLALRKWLDSSCVDIHYKDVYGHSALQLAVATAELNETLLFQTLRGFMEDAAENLVKEVQPELLSGAVPKELVCRLVCKGADAFYSTEDCGRPIDLINTGQPTSERSYIGALMLLHSAHSNIVAQLSTEQSRELSDVLTAAVCKSVWGLSRPITSAFALWIESNNAFNDMWSEFSDGRTCMTFVDLLYAAGEPLAHPGFLPRSRSLQFAIHEVLVAKSPNVPLAICLLKLHIEELIDHQSRKAPNHLKVDLKQYFQIREHEHSDIISWTWTQAWKRNHWDLIEAFIRLGIREQNFDPPPEKLAGLINYAFNNRRDFLARNLAGEGIQWQRIVYAKEKRLSHLILDAMSTSDSVPHPKWVLQANLYWQESKTFEYRFKERFPDIAKSNSIRLYTNIGKDIVKRFRLHITSVPSEGNQTQSIERQQFLRALLEELCRILLQVGNRSSQTEINGLIDSTLALGVVEEKKGKPNHRASFDHPVTEQARQGLGIWVAQSVSSKCRRTRHHSHDFAKYTPGMLFYVTDRVKQSAVKKAAPETPMQMCTAMQINGGYSHRGASLIAEVDFKPEYSCLRWTDRPLVQKS